MVWQQIIQPDLGVTDTPGSCLRFVQSVFGARAQFWSASEAGAAALGKHSGREMPSVAVPVFFTWSGFVNGVFAEYGHVAVWVPKRGQFLSSPLWWDAGKTFQWVNSLEAFESILGPSCRYLFWTETLNGLQIVSEVTKPKGVKMLLARMDDTGAVYLWNTSTGAYQGMDGTQFGVFSSALPIMHFANAGQFDSLRGGFSNTFTVPVADVSALAKSLAGTSVNVDAIAAAVAGKLGAVAEPITKAAVQAAIEANYLEGK
jgi:hypothetical protein